MGPEKKRQRNHLQRIASIARAEIAFVLFALFVFSNNAFAQIAPFSGTLEYQADGNTRPKIVIKSVNGAVAYVLTLQPERDVPGEQSHLDLVMHRPRASFDSPNLLNPPGIWHGLQEYMFNASDFVEGADHSVDGPVRTLHIRNRKLDVVISVSNVTVMPTAHPVLGLQDYVFKNLAIEVIVDNLKF